MARAQIKCQHRARWYRLYGARAALPLISRAFEHVCHESQRRGVDREVTVCKQRSHTHTWVAHTWVAHSSGLHTRGQAPSTIMPPEQLLEMLKSVTVMFLSKPPPCW
eukprot:863673-Rhodomonas_salina.3